MTKSRGINQPKCAWSAAAEAKLRRMYPDHTAADVAAAMGLRPQQVYARATKLGLSKSPEFLASPASGRTRGDHGQSTRFAKGAAPWCKGTKGVVGVQPSCRGTQFKRGRPAHESHNYVPIGTEKIMVGYLARKVTDDPSIVPVRRWQFVHRLVWIEAHGPIPPGHVVIFKRGKVITECSAITVDELELVTRAEVGRKNVMWNRYPREVAELIQLKGALAGKLNRRIKEAAK